MSESKECFTSQQLEKLINSSESLEPDQDLGKPKKKPKSEKQQPSPEKKLTPGEFNLLGVDLVHGYAYMFNGQKVFFDQQGSTKDKLRFIVADGKVESFINPADLSSSDIFEPVYEKLSSVELLEHIDRVKMMQRDGSLEKFQARQKKYNQEEILKEISKSPEKKELLPKIMGEILKTRAELKGKLGTVSKEQCIQHIVDAFEIDKSIAAEVFIFINQQIEINACINQEDQKLSKWGRRWKAIKEMGRGLFKTAGYVALGVGAVAVIGLTGGTALLVGAMGTTLGTIAAGSAGVLIPGALTLRDRHKAQKEKNKKIDAYKATLRSNNEAQTELKNSLAGLVGIRRHMEDDKDWAKGQAEISNARQEYLNGTIAIADMEKPWDSWQIVIADNMLNKILASPEFVNLSLEEKKIIAAEAAAALVEADKTNIDFEKYRNAPGSPMARKIGKVGKVFDAIGMGYWDTWGPMSLEDKAKHARRTTLVNFGLGLVARGLPGLREFMLARTGYVVGGAGADWLADRLGGKVTGYNNPDKLLQYCQDEEPKIMEAFQALKGLKGDVSTAALESFNESKKDLMEVIAVLRVNLAKPEFMHDIVKYQALKDNLEVYQNLYTSFDAFLATNGQTMDLFTKIHEEEASAKKRDAYKMTLRQGIHIGGRAVGTVAGLFVGEFIENVQQNMQTGQLARLIQGQGVKLELRGQLLDELKLTGDNKQNVLDRLAEMDHSGAGDAPNWFERYTQAAKGAGGQSFRELTSPKSWDFFKTDSQLQELFDIARSGGGKGFMTIDINDIKDTIDTVKTEAAFISKIEGLEQSIGSDFIQDGKWDFDKFKDFVATAGDDPETSEKIFQIKNLMDQKGEFLTGEQLAELNNLNPENHSIQIALNEEKIIQQAGSDYFTRGANGEYLMKDEIMDKMLASIENDTSNSPTKAQAIARLGTLVRADLCSPAKAQKFAELLQGISQSGDQDFIKLINQEASDFIKKADLWVNLEGQKVPVDNIDIWKITPATHIIPVSGGAPSMPVTPPVSGKVDLIDHALKTHPRGASTDIDPSTFKGGSAPPPPSSSRIEHYEAKTGHHAVRKWIFARASNQQIFGPDDIFQNTEAAKVLNVETNIVQGLQGKSLGGVSAAEFQSAFKLEGNKLVVLDASKADNILDRLFEHANQTIKPTSGAMAYIDDVAWKDLVEGKKAGVLVPDFSHDASVHAAEGRVFGSSIDKLFEGKATNIHVIDQTNGEFTIYGNEVIVRNGQVVSVGGNKIPAYELFNIHDKDAAIKIMQHFKLDLPKHDFATTISEATGPKVDTTEAVVIPDYLQKPQGPVLSNINSLLEGNRWRIGRFNNLCEAILKAERAGHDAGNLFGLHIGDATDTSVGKSNIAGALFDDKTLEHLTQSQQDQVDKIYTYLRGVAGADQVTNDMRVGKLIQQHGEWHRQLLDARPSTGAPSAIEASHSRISNWDNIPRGRYDGLIDNFENSAQKRDMGNFLKLKVGQVLDPDDGRSNLESNLENLRGRERTDLVGRLQFLREAGLIKNDQTIEQVLAMDDGAYRSVSREMAMRGLSTSGEIDPATLGDKKITLPSDIQQRYNNIADNMTQKARAIQANFGDKPRLMSRLDNAQQFLRTRINGNALGLEQATKNIPDIEARIAQVNNNLNLSPRMKQAMLDELNYNLRRELDLVSTYQAGLDNYTTQLEKLYQSAVDGEEALKKLGSVSYSEEFGLHKGSTKHISFSEFFGESQTDGEKLISDLITIKGMGKGSFQRLGNDQLLFSVEGKKVSTNYGFQQVTGHENIFQNKDGFVVVLEGDKIKEIVNYNDIQSEFDKLTRDQLIKAGYNPDEAHRWSSTYDKYRTLEEVIDRVHSGDISNRVETQFTSLEQIKGDWVKASQLGIPPEQGGDLVSVRQTTDGKWQLLYHDGSTEDNAFHDNPLQDKDDLIDRLKKVGSFLKRKAA